MVGIGTLAGAALGFTYFPVGRYWADTQLAGKVYMGMCAVEYLNLVCVEFNVVSKLSTRH